MKLFGNLNRKTLLTLIFAVTAELTCELALKSDPRHENAQVVDSVALPEILEGLR
jgi:hypothetical protein